MPGRPSSFDSENSNFYGTGKAAFDGSSKVDSGRVAPA